MSSSASVSVIIRTYNQAALLKQALDSVLGQTLLPAEIIVVDDASSDQTTELMAAYAGNPTVRYERLDQNQGMLRTGQIGFERSTGDHIAFLDHDDLWLPMHLALCLEAFERGSDIALVFTRYGLIDLQGQTFVQEMPEPTLDDSPMETLLFKRVIATPSRSVYSRRALAELGGVKPILWDWVYPVLLAERYPRGVIHLPERTAFFRTHGGQSYHQPDKLLKSLIESTEYLFSNLPAHRQHLKPRVHAVNLLNSAVFYWQAENSLEAWRCLGRALKTDLGCIGTRDFRVAFTRLLLPPTLGRVVRLWKRKIQRRRSADSARLTRSLPYGKGGESTSPK